MLPGMVAQSQTPESPPESRAGLAQEAPNDMCMGIVLSGQCNHSLQSIKLQS